MKKQVIGLMLSSALLASSIIGCAAAAPAAQGAPEAQPAAEEKAEEAEEAAEPVAVEAGLAEGGGREHPAAVHLHIIVADLYGQCICELCLAHHAFHHGQGYPGEYPGHEAMPRQSFLLHVIDHISLISLMDKLLDFP